MMQAIRQLIKVQSDGVVEVRSPELRRGDSVDVLITPAHANGTPTKAKDLMSLPLEHRRQILATHAEKLTDEYTPTAERDEWQAGDIIES